MFARHTRGKKSLRVLSPVPRQTTESLWNLGGRGFKHLRRKITKIVSHCRALKSQSVGIALLYCQSSQLKPHSARNFCKQTCPSLSYDQHVSTMFDWSSHSRASFAGERRFSKSRGLSASVSFLPLHHPLLLILGSHPNFARAKYHSGSIPWSFFALQPHRNACYAGYHEIQLRLI